ncbi:hypothetical protein Fmac_020925 [Flemingia macrophylla]|uniref:Uncharacterized protein n=1 Tax=Flemingia macrophylla TaxID=520843 RepID=A0ABD1LVX8_9FABA
MRFSLHVALHSIILKSLDPFPSSVRESPPPPSSIPFRKVTRNNSVTFSCSN